MDGSASLWESTRFENGKPTEEVKDAMEVLSNGLSHGKHVNRLMCSSANAGGSSSTYVRGREGSTGECKRNDERRKITKRKVGPSVLSCILTVRNGRRHDRHGVRRRCLRRVSHRPSRKRILSKRYTINILIGDHTTNVPVRSPAIKQGINRLFSYRTNVSFKIQDKGNCKAQFSLSSASSSSSSSLLGIKVPKRRRAGAAENQCTKDEPSNFSIVSDLIRRFGKLSEERESWLTYESPSDVEMKSRDLPRCETIVSEMTDAVEANERYDKFNITKMPVARSLSKSPQSDEGIEPDRSRDSVNRCWSLDSAVPSDDDALQNAQQRESHKTQVTRCCSSDSAILSDDDQNKCWNGSNLGECGECDSSEGQPRYWRTPSVVVSDYSDYSYLEEKFERNDLDLEKYGSISGTPSQASSCSCLYYDDIREFQDISSSLDNHLLQVCRHRRHSDSCFMCFGSTHAPPRNISGNENRRNSCLASPSSCYSSLDDRASENARNGSAEVDNKVAAELLDVPPPRKLSNCSTNSSLSGDDNEVTELQLIRPFKTSGWRKLRNIVQWTPFFQTYKKQRYPWVQLAGHQGNFRAGPTPGTILKKLCSQEEACFRLLMHDVLRPYVPEFKGVLDVRESEETGNRESGTVRGEEGEGDNNENKGTIVASYLQLQDLLGDFEQPCVMDCKVGVRTYLESELAKAKERPKLRKDMYEKMVQVDPSAPSSEERRVQGVTKPRYMVWRETISSTATLGFRVEGIKLAHGGSSKDFKTTRTREQVTEALKRFVDGYPHAISKYLQRLKAIRATLKASPFFASHEVVGSSLLFVHDATNAGVWMIDFAKTLPLPQHLPRIRHDAEWQVGNHEDGYLIGVNNLIDIFQDIRDSET